MPLPQEPLLLLLAVALLSVVMLAVLGCCACLSRYSIRSTEAEESAKSLLHDFLSVGEQQQLARFEYLVVRSPSVANREYRIPAGGGYVYGYESGKAIMAICLQPIRRLPAADVVLMHKLMIEGDEELYLRQANIQWLHASPARNRTTAADLMLPVANWTDEPQP